MEVPQIKRPRKHISHYAFEFLMLFLAVTLGFLVDNFREERADHKRVKKYMTAFMNDLETDMENIDSLKARREIRNVWCDSLIYRLNDPAPHGAELYYYGRNASRRLHFYSRDITLEQMKSTGIFRVVEDDELLNTINHYLLLQKSNKENIEVEEKELSDYAQLASRIFDARVFIQMTQGDSIQYPAGNPKPIIIDRLMLNETANKLNYWKRTSQTVLETYVQMRSVAKELIAMIRDKYDLKSKKKH
jgi:hypothetical protein